MILLLALIIIIAINSLTLSGAAEGIKFYLIPDLEKVQSIGIRHIITSAMSQAIVYTKPWHCFYGNFRQLYDKRKNFAERIN